MLVPKKPAASSPTSTAPPLMRCHSERCCLGRRRGELVGTLVPGPQNSIPAAPTRCTSHRRNDPRSSRPSFCPRHPCKRRSPDRQDRVSLSQTSDSSSGILGTAPAAWPAGHTGRQGDPRCPRENSMTNHVPEGRQPSESAESWQRCQGRPPEDTFRPPPRTALRLVVPSASDVPPMACADRYLERSRAATHRCGTCAAAAAGRASVAPRQELAGPRACACQHGPAFCTGSVSFAAQVIPR